jgi:DNA-binding CsgD family transcriptional regulator
MDGERWDRLTTAFGLSPREVEVARSLLAGRTEGETAAELQISNHTVHHYAARLYAKLKVANRTQLTLRIEAAMSEFGDGGNTPSPPLKAWASRGIANVSDARQNPGHEDAERREDLYF